MTDQDVSPVVAEGARQRIAVLAVVVLAAATCLGLAWDSSGTGERGNATIASALHHHAPASIHLDGVAALAAVALAAQLWASQRIGHRGAHVSVATNLVRRRGPPLLLA